MQGGSQRVAKRFWRGSRISLTGLAGLFFGCVIHAQPPAPRLLHNPSLSRTHVAFGYAGYIWIANLNGTDARRLTRGGRESDPVFSPDGDRIAFVGEHDGARAVYVVASRGGEPRRLTFHPADLGVGPTGDVIGVPNVLSWTRDGHSILFNSRRTAFYWYNGRPFTSQLFTVPAEGGPVAQVPLATAAQAAFSPDGRRMAYVPNLQRHISWKRYRGGETTPIWIVDLADSSIQARIPRTQSNDSNPMWVGDTIYFLSDRNGAVTLFAYDVKTRQVRQLIRNTGLDIRSASATSEAIVYEQFGSLHRLDLTSGQDRVLDIRPTGDFPQVRPHSRKIGPAQIQFADLSPDGSRAVFGARGEILTVPAEAGDVRDITRSTDVVERDPAWSPDGRSIAYFSDASGEYALHIADASGRGKVRKIPLGEPPGFYYSPVWSPDGKKIGYTDHRFNYAYVDLEKQTSVRVDTDPFADPNHARQLVWSPDSRSLAYTRQLQNRLHALFLYSLEDGKTHQLTDGRSDALYVAFDKSGELLYFTSSTDAALSAGWLDMSGLRRPVTRNVYALTLRDGSLAPLPIPARNYYGLCAGKPGTLFLVEGPEVDPLEAKDFGGLRGALTKVHKVDAKSGRSELLLDEVLALPRFIAYAPSFRVSGDGERMLYARRGHWFISPTGSAGATASTPLDAQAMEIYVDPRAQWKHMYAQVWRNERDFFYDPGLHGLDLRAVRKQYEPYLKNLASGEDLNDLFNEMLGNLSAGHVGALGGVDPTPPPENTGLLGADYEVANGRYRFARIYRGDTWDPEMRAPLAAQGVNVREGEYLLAVDGQDVRVTSDVYSFFERKAGKSVVLRVGAESDGSGAREVTVTPVQDETPLRNYAWIEANRRKVTEMSGGRVAYIYVPDTHVRGYVSFNRDFFAQTDKAAAIVDQRYNSGGILADHIVDSLRRPMMSYWHLRYGQDIASPQQALFGPKVMIVNGVTGSGGDYLAWMFRRSGLGPLIGTRTWGGLVGMYANPDDLLDGGRVSTPNLAFYNPDGSWDVENHGVAPDIEVEEDPQAIRQGHDLQLEKAVAVVLEMLQQSPPLPERRHPAFPRYPQSTDTR